MDYSSTQFDLNSDDTKSIQDFIESVIDLNKLHEYGVEENSHITIKYGLHDVLPNKLNELLLGQKPVTVMLGKVSIFDSDEDYDVVKIDVVSGDLRKLNKLIGDNMENSDEHPVYKPHLTLAYVAKGEGQYYVGRNDFEGKIITFNKVTFSPSEGEDTYIYLGEWDNDPLVKYQKDLMNAVVEEIKKDERSYS